MITELETKKSIPTWKVRACGLLTTASLFLVASVSAVDFSGITNVTDDVALLFVPLVAVVIAAIPINLHRSVLAVGDHDCAGNCRVYSRPV